MTVAIIDNSSMHSQRLSMSTRKTRNPDDNHSTSEHVSRHLIENYNRLLFNCDFKLNSNRRNMCCNDSNSPELPIDMRFNEGHVVSIATYSVLLVISACGNITILFNLTRRHYNRNLRVNLMLIHLAIADLLVSFYFI